MEPQRRDLAYNAYLKEHPNGNFARFSQLSQAGKRSYGDPTAAAVVRLELPLPRGAQPVARVGQSSTSSRSQPLPSGDGLKELRRKIAWAVGSVYRIPYTKYDTWPADYARRAAERLIELHGAP